MENQITPGPWKWVFLGTAGNYFLLGNDGEGPITHSGPDTPDGRLKEAAPLMLAALTESIGMRDGRDFASDLEATADLLEAADHFHNRAEALRAKAQAIRGAIAAARGE